MRDDSTAVFTFESLCLVTKYLQTFANIISNFLACNADNCRMTNCLLFKDCNVCCTAADINKSYAYFFFFFIKHSEARCKRFENDVIDTKPCTLNTVINILYSGYKSVNYMNSSFQANTRHTYRFVDAILSVNDVFLRNDMKYLSVIRQIYFASFFNKTFYIIGRYCSLMIRDRYDTTRLKRLNMVSSNTNDNFAYLHTG